MTDKLTRVEYPISAGYVQRRGIKEVLRELLANAVDAKAKDMCGYADIEAYWKDGYAYVEDNGTGFSKSCLMLGEGEEKTNKDIGQFMKA